MKKILRLIGLLMLLINIIFVIVALNHPELSFPWSNVVTYIIYGIYDVIMVVLIIAPVKR